MSDKIVLTRNQLAKFLPTPEAIKAFENLFKLSTVKTPLDLQEIAIDSATASSIANEALDYAVSTKEELELLQSAPQNDNIAELIKLLNDLKLSPPVENHGFADLDYVQFRNSHTQIKTPGKLHWSYSYGDLQFTHIGGLVQNLGIDSMAHVYNGSGVTINKGEVISFNGISGGDIQIQKFIADGTVSSLYLMGSASETIASGERGHVTLFGYIRDVDASGTAYSESWSIGDVLYASPTSSGGYTNVKPTAPNNCIPVAVVLDNSSTVGDLYIRTLVEQQFHYGNFIDTTTQTPAAINTAYAVTFDTTSLANGVSRGTPTSRIVVATSGLYTFSVSVQLQSTNASIKNVWVWFRKNGTDIPNSSTKVSLESASAISAPSLSFAVSLAASDYIEVMYASDSVAVSLVDVPATAFSPACPSIILVVEQTAQ